MLSTQKQPSFKKGVPSCKMAGMKKVCGCQEMAVMVGQWQKF